MPSVAPLKSVEKNPVINILEKLRTRSGSTAADHRARLAEIEAELPAAEARVRNAEQQRAAGLLDLSDAELEKIEGALRLAVRDRDRLRAAREELERRTGAAEETEFLDALNGRRAAIEKRAASFAAKLPAEYDRLAAPLVALLTEQIEIEREIAAVNAADGDAVRERRIEPRDAVLSVDARANEFRNVSVSYVGFPEMTSLRPGKGQPGWGGAREAFKIAGLKPQA